MIITLKNTMLALVIGLTLIACKSTAQPEIKEEPRVLKLDQRNMHPPAKYQCEDGTRVDFQGECPQCPDNPGWTWDGYNQDCSINPPPLDK